MTVPASNPQLTKLARTLGVSEQRIAYLAEVPPADLNRFRGQVADRIYAEHAAGIARITLAARIIPPSIAVRLILRNGSPLLTARLAAATEHGRAVEIARRLPADFLADVAAHLDATQAGRLVSALPPSTVCAVVARLAAAADWVTLGTLVPALPPPLLRAVVGELDGVAILRCAAMTDSPEHAAALAAALDATAVDRARGAAERHLLWDEWSLLGLPR